MIIKERAFARAGLIGNPSDGFFGKTISFIVKNFAAEVTLWHSPELEILPSQQDHSRFKDIDSLVQDVRLNGYYGGVRLIKGAIKRFADYCSSNSISLDNRNFTVRYSSTIPRQLGMGGSSAIITAAMKAMMSFYEVSIPKHILPSIILSVETDELGISGGLQDRVIQVYEGMVYMDFAEEFMKGRGYGEYESLEPALLPRLFVAYRPDLAGPSGKVHNSVRERWQLGEKAVINAMKEFADCAAQARQALIDGQHKRLAELMNANFDLRRRIYNISPPNLEMVEIARRLDAACKFAGSGGAVVGTYEDDEHFHKLESAYQEAGITILKPVVT